MLLGIVRGDIYSTIHHSVCAGKKLLIVDLTDAAWKPTGKYVIAVDAAGAGVGEHVLINDEGNGARQILGDDKAPVRTVIVGIVDALSLHATNS